MYEDLIEEKISSEDIFDGVFAPCKTRLCKITRMAIKRCVNGLNIKVLPL